MENWPVVIAGGDVMWWLQSHKDLAPWVSFVGTMLALAVAIWNGRAGERKEEREHRRLYRVTFETCLTAFVSVRSIRRAAMNGQQKDQIDLGMEFSKGDICLSGIDCDDLKNRADMFTALHVRHLQDLGVRHVGHIASIADGPVYADAVVAYTGIYLRHARVTMRALGRDVTPHGVRLAGDPAIPMPIFLKPTLWVAIRSKRFRRHAKIAARQRLKNLLHRA